MKKRILGLALALVMIISLLPMAAFAEASSSVKVRLSDPVSGNLDAGLSSGQTKYYVFEDVMDATDTTLVIGNKPVEASAAPATGGYIKVQYSSAGVMTITLNNINYKRSASSSTPFIQGYKNTTTGATNEFDIVIELVGTNKIEGANASMRFENTGKTTIQGSGSLEFAVSQSNKKGVIWSGASSELIVKNTSLKIVVEGGSSTRYAIVSKGPITIDGANVDISNDNGTSLTTRTGVTGDINSATLNDSAVTIKNNSTFKSIVAGGTAAAIATNGTVTFENSNVYMSHSNTRGSGTGSAYSILSKAPTIIGTYSTKQAAEKGYAQSNLTYKEYDSFNLTAGDQLERGSTAGTLIKTINLVHKHEASGTTTDCTAAATCACGYAMGASATAHAGVVTDCTKDTMCTNPGCQQVYKAKVADAHEANADDGDCTTAVTCKHCTTVMTTAKEKHNDTRTDCAAAGTCANTGCTHAFTAGQHNPAADDGDCTTDIKCATCGKVATKGQAEHKYTDKNDTTCNNAGCTKTRTAGTTENPKTGDNTALVLVATLMVTAAAAFVTTKKFVR